MRGTFFLIWGPQVRILSGAPVSLRKSPLSAIALRRSRGTGRKPAAQSGTLASQFRAQGAPAQASATAVKPALRCAFPSALNLRAFRGLPCLAGGKTAAFYPNGLATSGKIR